MRWDATRYRLLSCFSFLAILTLWIRTSDNILQECVLWCNQTASSARHFLCILCAICFIDPHNQINKTCKSKRWCYLSVRRSSRSCRFAAATSAAAVGTHNWMQCSPERISNSAYRIPALSSFLLSPSLSQFLSFSSNGWYFYFIIFYCNTLWWYGTWWHGAAAGGASMWMLYDVDAFTDLNLNKARKYLSLVTAVAQFTCIEIEAHKHGLRREKSIE